MNVAGIIAEYNPFHAGHQYHLQQTRKLTQADYLVVVLSGNFVQRGEPAIFDKSVRTHMALLCGADLVLELPAPFACGSAEDFAMGAVSLLHRLGVITHLSFGSESGALPALTRAAQIALKEPPLYRETLKNALRQGLSYPQARSIAFGVSGLAQEDAALIEQPNNLLGMEYLKALLALDSPISPVTLQRKGSAYHAQQFEHGSYASATALRKAIASSPSACTENSHGFLAHIPSSLYSFYQKDSCFPLCLDDFSSILHYKILLRYHQLSTPSSDQFSAPSSDQFSTTSSDRLSHPLSGQIFDYLDFSSELANRLLGQALTPLSFTERIRALKTRQYTYTRISRALLHLMLDIRRTEMEAYRNSGYSSYARILGFRRESAPLFKQIKKHASIPLVSKAADAKTLLPFSAQPLWNKDIFCSQVYSLVLQEKYKIMPPDEYRRQIILLPMNS